MLTVSEKEKKLFSVKKIAIMGMFCALSVVLVLIFHPPIIPSAPFLEFDFGDVPILIVSFFYGPLSGLITAFTVSVVQGVTVSAQSGIYGIIMHFISASVYTVIVGLIYKYRKSSSKILPAAALAAGALAVCAVMVGANLIITPLFMKVPVSMVWKMVPTAILPFNAIKTASSGVITYLIYKPISKFLNKVW